MSIAISGKHLRIQTTGKPRINDERSEVCIPIASVASREVYNAVQVWCGKVANAQLDVHPVRVSRTDKQNRYLHAILHGFAEFTGNDVETVKQEMKFAAAKVGSYPSRNIDVAGERCVYLPSSSDLSLEQMRSFIDWLLMHLAEVHKWVAPTEAQADLNWEVMNE